MMRTRRGFTLIELLTVMAMSAILLGLIIIPLVQSFNLTRSAQAFSEAQDRARILSERIANEIGNAYSVRAAGLVDTTLNGAAAKIPAGSTIVSVSTTENGYVEVVLPNTRLDLVRPAEGDQSQVATGGFTNLEGKIDPTIQSPKGQVVLPVAPGFAMIRYYIGRRDPFKEYNNPYDGVLLARNSDRDNLYVLYRIEVQPLKLRPGAGTNGDTSVRWRPNLDYFQSDPVTDMNVLDIDDPKFFEPNRDGTGAIITDDARADRIRKWQSRSVIQTEVSRYDMIEPVYDLRTRAWIRLPGTQIPKIVPLIQFRPERISNDPAVGHMASREGEESDAAEAAGPDVYTTQYAQWASFVVRLFPRGWDTNPSRNSYEVGISSEHAGEAGYAPGLSIYGYDPEANPDDFDINYLKGNELFDVSTYSQLSSLTGSGARVYPFTAAVEAANSRSGFLNSGAWNSIFTPFTVDRARGKVITSIGIEEVGDANVAPTIVNNLPYAFTSYSAPLSPGTDTRTDTVSATTLVDPQYQPINDKFNLIYRSVPSLLPNGVHRFIDLRTTRNSDGTPSPLFPNRVANQATGFTIDTTDGGYRNRGQIVPGSENVTGPDQLPGPHYGQAIRYTRVTVGEPGPNQYKINYADVAEPTNDATGVIDYSGTYPGISMAGFNPRVYDPTNFVSAVLQPRYKVGYIQLNSDPNVPLPYTSGASDSAQAGFRISYRFQFTGTLTAQPVNGGRTKMDSVAVDYDSRELISVLLTIRNYPQSSQPNPQNVTLKSTAKVRNYSR